MTDLSYALPHGTRDPAPMPVKALGIVFFTGFAIVATAVGFVFLPVAGLLIALLVGWQGFAGRIWWQDQVALRVLSMIGFTAFAVVATVLGFVFLAPAGLLLAIWFLVRGFSGFASGAPFPAPQPQPAPAPRGNSAFDAYRAEMLQRMEQEQRDFDGFLQRLRDAKDMSEFDEFMNDRARRARDEGDAVSTEEPHT